MDPDFPLGKPPVVYKPISKDANTGYRSGPWGSKRE